MDRATGRRRPRRASHGASTAPAASVLVGEQLAEHLEGLSVAELHSELAEATAHTAKARADYADALVEKRRGFASKDLYALGVATEAAKAVWPRAGPRGPDLGDPWALRATKDQERRTTSRAIPERFVDVEEFVTQFFAPVIERRLGGGPVWCPKWWDHPEAVEPPVGAVAGVRGRSGHRADRCRRGGCTTSTPTWRCCSPSAGRSASAARAKARRRSPVCPTNRHPRGGGRLSGDLDTPVDATTRAMAGDHDDVDERSRP